MGALLLGVAASIAVALMLCSSLLLLPTREAWRYTPPSGGVGGRMGSLVRLREQELAWPSELEPPDDDAPRPPAAAKRGGGTGGGAKGGARGGANESAVGDSAAERSGSRHRGHEVHS